MTKRKQTPKEMRKQDHKTNIEKQFEQQRWSYTYSGIFSSNMYGINHPPKNPTDVISSWQWMEADVKYSHQPMCRALTRQAERQ
jgi:hypothetical protein